MEPCGAPRWVPAPHPCHSQHHGGVGAGTGVHTSGVSLGFRGCQADTNGPSAVWRQGSVYPRLALCDVCVTGDREAIWTEPHIGSPPPSKPVGGLGGGSHLQALTPTRLPAWGVRPEPLGAQRQELSQWRRWPAAPRGQLCDLAGTDKPPLGAQASPGPVTATARQPTTARHAGDTPLAGSGARWPSPSTRASSSQPSPCSRSP